MSYKKNLKIINKIKSIRAKNNTYWMDILKLAFKHAPSKSKMILRKIENQDKAITKLVRKLSK